MHVSAKGKKVIKKMAKGENVVYENSGLSKREWNELMVSFEFKNQNYLIFFKINFAASSYLFI